MKKWANVTLCIIIFLLIGYGVSRVAKAPDVVSLFNPGEAVSPRALAFGDHVSLEKYKFEINQVTHEVRADFWLANTGKTPVRDVEILCDLLDRSGARHGKARWVLYDTLAADSSNNHIDVSDKRYISHLVTPDSISCRIVDLSNTSFMVAEHEGDGH